MKNSLITMFVSALIITGCLLLNNQDTSASNNDKNTTCCQDICISKDGRPVVGCSIVVSGNGVEIPATTNGSGKATVCVEEGHLYTISILCDCNLTGLPPSFTACNTGCVEINCQ